MSYSQDQADSLYIAKRRLHHSGQPQMVAIIDTMMASGRPYDEIWDIANSDLTELVRPEVPADKIPLPPLQGPGASTKNWREFALRVSTIEEEVILTLGRNEIVRILVDKEIIDDPGPLLGEPEYGVSV